MCFPGEADLRSFFTKRICVGVETSNFTSNLGRVRHVSGFTALFRTTFSCKCNTGPIFKCQYPQTRCSRNMECTYICLPNTSLMSWFVSDALVTERNSYTRTIKIYWYIHGFHKINLQENIIKYHELHMKQWCNLSIL